jgi:hypothetical protein
MTTIEIRKFDGPDESQPIALWKDGNWIKASDEARFIGEDRFEDMDAESILEHFDGPYLFAVPSDNMEKMDTSNSNRSFDFVEGSDSGRVRVDRVEEAPEDAVVHATVDDEGDVKNLWYEP